MTDKHIYLRLKKRVLIQPGQQLSLADLAQVLVPEGHEHVTNLPIYDVPIDEHYIVLDALYVVDKLTQHDPSLFVKIIGPSESILEVDQKQKVPSRLALVFVWLLLFIGSGLAIINFHTDVSMLQVHQRIHYLVTGRTSEQPLWLQIPYSFGIGLGMVLFFNHLFKRRFNEEPSPLEVEMNLYQENIDRYVVQHEKDKG